jgi:ubiquitin-like 1-activating enzyme E1 B
MEDMWKVPGRVKPVPLDYELIMNDSFIVPPLAKKAAPTPAESSKAEGATTDKPPAEVARGSGKLKDQQELSVKDNLKLFLDR